MTSKYQSTQESKEKLLKEIEEVKEKLESLPTKYPPPKRLSLLNET